MLRLESLIVQELVGLFYLWAEARCSKVEPNLVLGRDKEEPSKVREPNMETGGDEEQQEGAIVALGGFCCCHDDCCPGDWKVLDGWFVCLVVDCRCHGVGCRQERW